MPRAGVCDVCGERVWLTDGGACPAGHGPEHILNPVDVEVRTQAPVGQPRSGASAASTRVSALWRIVAVALALIVVGGAAFLGFRALVGAGGGSAPEAGTAAERPAVSGPSEPSGGDPAEPVTLDTARLEAELAAANSAEWWYADLVEVRSTTKLGMPVIQASFDMDGERLGDASEEIGSALMEAAGEGWSGRWELFDTADEWASGGNATWAPELEYGPPPENTDELLQWLNDAYGGLGEEWVESISGISMGQDYQGRDAIVFQVTYERDVWGADNSRLLAIAVSQSGQRMTDSIMVEYPDGERYGYEGPFDNPYVVAR